MLDVDVNLVSFGSLVPDSEYRSESGKAEKVVKYYLVLTSKIIALEGWRLLLEQGSAHVGLKIEV
jgi:hypothetical protein